MHADAPTGPHHPRPSTPASTCADPATGAERAGDPPPTQAAAEIGRRYGVPAWYGRHTGQYWALVEGRGLVEAADPHELGPRIETTRRRLTAAPGGGGPAARPGAPRPVRSPTP